MGSLARHVHLSRRANSFLLRASSCLLARLWLLSFYFKKSKWIFMAVNNELEIGGWV